MLRIFLDETDAPNPADREAAKRIVEEMIDHHVHSKGPFVLEGYAVARSIAQALTAARLDERRKGFDTPYKMRKARTAPGAPAVLAKWPSLRPLYHWIEVDGVRLQSYRGAWNKVVMYSDDARISLEWMVDFWSAYIDGVRVIDCGAARRFETIEEAARAALQRLAAGLD